MPEEVPPEELFAVLDDEYARALLVRLADESMSAKRLHEATGASLPTVYRRLDALADCGLVAERTELDEDGNHYGVYEATLREVRVTLTTEGFDADVTEREDVADKFTRVWEGMK